MPATTSVPLVVKLLDSRHRPPAFVMGANGSSTVLEGKCAPSYVEVLLEPLGAYMLLGLPLDALSGQIVDLVDVLGAGGRRLAEQLREASTWRQRFALLDQLLLRRLARGPRPSPEVGWVWQQLVAAGGTVPIRRIADEVGWSHKPLIARFRQQVGLRPKTAARLVRFDGVLRRLDERRPLDWGADRPRGHRPPRPDAGPLRPPLSGDGAGDGGLDAAARPRLGRHRADGRRDVHRVGGAVPAAVAGACCRPPG